MPTPKEAYDKWLNYPHLAPELKEELEAVRGQDDEIGDPGV